MRPILICVFIVLTGSPVCAFSQFSSQMSKAIGDSLKGSSPIDLSVTPGTSSAGQSVSYSNLALSGAGPHYAVSYARMQAFTTASEFKSIFLSQKADKEAVKKDLNNLNKQLKGEQLDRAAQIVAQMEDRRFVLQNQIFDAHDDPVIIGLGAELLNLEFERMNFRLGIKNAINGAELLRQIRQFQQP